MPQRGAGGEARSASEEATFERALEGMAAMYASMTSTAVLQLRERERMHMYEFDGRLVIYGVGGHDALNGAGALGGDDPMANVQKELTLRTELQARARDRPAISVR